MNIGQFATFTKTFTQEEFDLFAKLSGDDNPIHVDPEFSARTKFGKTVAHGMLLYSTIGRCLGALMPGSGTVQIFQELMFPNPTFVDQEIIVHLKVVDFPTPDRALITTNVIQPDGKLGCEGKTLVWLPGTRPDYAQISYSPPKYESDVDRRDAEEHRGLRIGDKTSQTRTFSLDDISAFRDLVSEENATIADSGYAQLLGFKRTIVPGGLLGGTVSDILGTKLPGRGTNWLKQKYHFLAPAYPDEEITTMVEIIRLRPEKDLVNLRTTLINPHGKIFVDGEALVWVSDLETK